MSFTLPKFTPPDFTQDFLKNAPNCKIEIVEKDGVSPRNYHALSIYPEYFKINGKWVIANESRMDTVAVVTDDERVEIVEFRNLKKGDKVVIGRTEDASEGIYMYTQGFESKEGIKEAFAFRSGRSRETAFSKDYDELYEILRYEKENNGHIVWVLGPSITFDSESRKAFTDLVNEGFVNAVLSGNSFGGHDLESSMYGTILGEDHFEFDTLDHYNQLDAINEMRKYDSPEEFFAKSPKVKEGILKACYDKKVPVVLAGTIRDRYPLPIVIDDVYKAQDAMRSQTRKATVLLCLSTVLHTIAAGNMTPSYTVKNGVVRPVYIYSVDIQEFSVNKLSDRGSLETKTVVTNVQDFIINVRNGVLGREK